MDSFNKVISFALGLIVVLVFFAVVTGKINLKSKTSTSASKTTITPTPAQKNNSGFFGLFRSATPTPTPTVKPISSIKADTSENNIYKQNTTTSSAKSIPSTGLPTLFIPMLISGLAGGSLLRKAGKNK
ncbi:MAG: hypothetical protein NUV87_00565 [Candidatus Roizmanbacteria bacterium]|nr:hypothetical protein [Candidatus Roizmanbacteria bacterium]MCR4312733.1 hypothetical protein [Candidatus Roizmanbacteria bacterium]